MTPKEISEIFVLPLAICGMGIWATLKSTEVQNKNAGELADGQYALSKHNHEQTINFQVSSEFFALLTETNACKSPQRINFIIGEAATSERASQLRSVFIDYCTTLGSAEYAAIGNDPGGVGSTGSDGVSAADSLSATTASAVDVAKNRELTGLISDLDGGGRRTARKKLTDLYERNEPLVAQKLATTLKTKSDDYRTGLGALTVLGSAQDGWQANGELLQEFEKLETSPNMNDPTFKKWYEKAKQNQKK